MPHSSSSKLGRNGLCRLWQLIAVGVPFAITPVTHADEVWHLADLSRVGGYETKIVGAPKIVGGDAGQAVQFDGAHDGLFVPTIPIAGARGFTIEVLISPAEGGPQAQRFFHVQDVNGRRALMEIRTNGKGGWWLDTFLRSGGASTDKGLTLIDPKRIHATAQWYWVALRYDGARMSDLVNGVKELEGEIAFPPLGNGVVSIGVRQNLVYWFQGRIREVRFHSGAIADDKLQRVK